MIHREFTSTYQAKFVIENDRMFTQNANRASWEGLITPENMEPNPKNPIIASFFRTIGLADQLGSGVRNLFAYSRLYSGEDPVIQEKDIFTITVPLRSIAEEYDEILNTETLSTDKDHGSTTKEIADTTKETTKEITGTTKETTEEIADTTKETTEEITGTTKEILLREIQKNPGITVRELASMIGLTDDGVRYHINKMRKEGILARDGSTKSGHWVIQK